MTQDAGAWLNYHHLQYFHRVARAGSLTAAARELRVSHSTLSVQIKELGERLGGPLFERRGRNLVLTPRGEIVQEYAGDIFRLGQEMTDVALGRREASSRVAVRIGVVPSVPRPLALRLLAPALEKHAALLAIRVDGLPRLLEELAAGRLHVVLCDAPPAEPLRGRAFVHPLGRSGVALYARREVAARVRPGFPRSLQDQPLVMPSAASGLGRLVERWLSERAIRPNVAAEVDDAAWLRVLGLAGHGIFPVRLALHAEVDDVPGLARVGVLEGAEETYYAVSLERRVRHPFVAELVREAREALDLTVEAPSGAPRRRSRAAPR